MKRDDELIRKIVLKVEELGNSPNTWIDSFTIEDTSIGELNYHVWLLGDAGYMRIDDHSSLDGDCFVPRCLTAAGHDFAGSICDEMIWTSTKKAARETGAATLDMLGQLAKAFIRQKIKEKTGLDLVD